MSKATVFVFVFVTTTVPAFVSTSSPFLTGSVGVGSGVFVGSGVIVPGVPVGSGVTEASGVSDGSGVTEGSTVVVGSGVTIASPPVEDFSATVTVHLAVTTMFPSPLASVAVALTSATPGFLPVIIAVFPLCDTATQSLLAEIWTAAPSGRSGVKSTFTFSSCAILAVDVFVVIEGDFVVTTTAVSSPFTDTGKLVFLPSAAPTHRKPVFSEAVTPSGVNLLSLLNNT